MEEKDNKDVIGVVDPVVDEVENIGKITPESQQSEPYADVVEEVKTPVVEEPLQQAQKVQQTQQVQEPIVDQNKKILAGVMGILFGAFGVHNFIYGYTGKAIAQLLITLLSCFLLSWVSAIWGLIEGIMILTDSILPKQ
ncbi:MAG: TM2 domain-containing protein [Firmicutes bacterium]|nr:TM2 domain-containing protein [Bacillota bacterium]